MILIAWAKALIQLSLDRLTGANTHWEQRRGEKGKGGGGWYQIEDSLAFSLCENEVKRKQKGRDRKWNQNRRESTTTITSTRIHSPSNTARVKTKKNKQFTISKHENISVWRWLVEKETHVKTAREMKQSKTPKLLRSNMNVYLLNLFISFVFISPPPPPSPPPRLPPPPLPLLCYLCSRYWAMHWGCVELIRTVIDGRVDDLSFRLNTRLDICLLDRICMLSARLWQFVTILALPLRRHSLGERKKKEKEKGEAVQGSPGI